MSAWQLSEGISDPAHASIARCFGFLKPLELKISTFWAQGTELFFCPGVNNGKYVAIWQVCRYVPQIFLI